MSVQAASQTIVEDGIDGMTNAVNRMTGGIITYARWPGPAESHRTLCLVGTPQLTARVAPDLPGNGPRITVRRTTPRTRITTPDGKVREGNFGWDDLWTYASADAGDTEETQKRGGTPKVPDGTTITQWLMDDTLPGGPREVQRTYTAPFARASREDDYRVAWEFFEGQRDASQL